MNTIIKKSAVPGIHYIVSTVSSYKYLTIIHDKSNKSIADFSHSPVEKHTDVIKISDKILGQIDWNIPESKITNAHEKIVHELKKSVVLSNGRYVIKN